MSKDSGIEVPCDAELRLEGHIIPRAGAKCSTRESIGHLKVKLELSPPVGSLSGSKDSSVH